MRKRIEYKSDAEMESLIAEQEGLVLKEVQNYKEGNFLIFGPPLTQEEQDAENTQTLATFRRTKSAELEKTDLSMARVIEDLLNILQAKGIVSINELTAEAQQKIQEREELRNQLREI